MKMYSRSLRNAHLKVHPLNDKGSLMKSSFWNLVEAELIYSVMIIYVS